MNNQQHSRADALTFEITAQIAAEWADRNELENVLTTFSTQRNAIEDARTLHLLAASPVEQHEAAPADCVKLEHVAVAEDGGKLRWMTGRKPRDCELYAMPDGGRVPPTLYLSAQPAPCAPLEGTGNGADERVAFDMSDAEWCDVFERIQKTVPNVFGSYMKVRAEFAREAIRIAAAARASSPNAAGADSDTERALSETIDERDQMEEAGTRLANAVGEFLGVDVGEWSSANNPILVAIEAL
ncbi:hypothetical protein [Burkholderia cepacia]|uniref:hypothetical protein n=1 Tax=Burkholderia cepacia TaxID=292 RepID=UPI001CF1C484|nr:hypothetical protein [Burkholderia cepacia]MCA8026528.1 hypothetical protein [Burkholderia cepacia]